MSEKHKKNCRDLHYFEHFYVFVSAVSGCVSISAFASLVGVPIGVAINHDEFVSVNNVSREYNEIKEEIKNLKNVVE